MSSIAATVRASHADLGARSLLYAAWAIALLLTVPEIVLRAFMGVDTSWMLLARIALLIVSVG